MKQTIAYGAYFLIVATVTYFVEIFLSFMIMGILFDAADAPPGDVSDKGKLLFSVGMPVVYAFVLFALYYQYNAILKSFKNHLMLSVGVLFHILIAIYLIWNVVPDAF
ncbi:hypothetical protein CSE16_10210 [Solibacillus sp. R5-41]|uniref:hypothetical protein n=1 Tax=Solibacillus sp. R5-41 TaxID=2048654 RepID=UPI000C126445|nr:hypothetical protein [Solibacillus sp. R5-41]ATP40391.1 hypothetical protein CSE16_10210 [Solibacillus sp. R5-41]